MIRFISAEYFLMFVLYSYGREFDQDIPDSMYLYLEGISSVNAPIY